VTVEVENLSYP